MELAEDAPVGTFTLLTEVLLSLISPLVGKINTLNLVRTDTITLGVSRWVLFRDPPYSNIELIKREPVTLLKGTALCALILLLASRVDL